MTEGKQRFFPALAQLLALEYHCSPEEIDRDNITLTTPILQPGQRQYSPEAPFFSMVSTGRGAVITADRALHPFLREHVKGKEGHWLFELPNLLPLEAELHSHGYTLSQSHHMFLPARETRVRGSFPLRWLSQEEIFPFYGDGRFPNALCPEFLPHRPDRLAVCAMDGDQIMGMAGCSEDAPGWLQIGIDVLPAYRSRGVGSFLVGLLKEEVLRRGGIPFYGTGVSNYHSWNIALNCGFCPAWLEIGARPLPRDEQ